MNKLLVELRLTVIHAVWTCRIITRLPISFFSDLIKSLDRIQDYLEAKFDEHMAKFNGQVHDLIDGYIKAMQEQTELNYTTFSGESKPRIIHRVTKSQQMQQIILWIFLNK